MIKKAMYLILILFCFFISINSVLGFNETDLELSGIIEDTVVIDDSFDSKTINITQDNYDEYFNKYTGEIKQNSGINSGDTLQIGNISNRGFVINRQLTITHISSNDQIYNGFIHLIKGSDKSTISGIAINNTEAILKINSQEVGYLHGIWLSDSNYNTISHNIIRIANSGGVYAMPMHCSSYNRIVYNDMKTYVSSNIIMSSCNYNLISNNDVEVLSYSDQSVTNLIYFSPFAFAGRLEPALSVGNTISYNNLIGFCTLPMSIIIQGVHSNNVNTTVANNTIYRGSYGINLLGDNLLVYGNIVNGSAIGISANGKNISINGNIVLGSSLKQGIVAIGDEKTQAKIFNNDISFKDISQAIYVGNYVDVYDNTVIILDYGNGIYVGGNYSNIQNNKIKTSFDDAIVFLGNNNLIDSNIIITNAKGISISSPSARYYNNTIKNNKITSDSYGIYINGLVYYTTISTNVIETNASTGIYKSITDEIADNDSDNMINGVIYDATALTVSDENYYEYFNNDGYLTYNFKENSSKTIFLTFLSNKNIILNQKVNIVSNKQSNLLFNVSITFTGDASGSLIRDFNFVNNNLEAIVLDSVDDVNVVNNNVTLILTKNTKYDSAIFVNGVGDDNIISNNNLYVNSKSDYAYAISISSYNPNTFIYSREFSKGFKVTNNTIIMISKGMAEAIFSDSLSESRITSNKINIITEESGYGIASVNVIGRPYDLNISDNNIVIHSNKMAYLIELHMSDDVFVQNNYLYSKSNGVFGIVTYMSNNISIANNELNIFGGDLFLINGSADVVGVGVNAIFISKFSNFTNISNNTINTNFNPILIDNSLSIVNFTNTTYIISNENYGLYFNSENNIFKADDTLMLCNLTDNQALTINVPLNIESNSNVCVSLIIENTSKISNAAFINSTIILNNAGGVLIANNSLFLSNIKIINSNSNYLVNNKLVNSSIEFENSKLNNIISNDFDGNISNLIFVSNSLNISILNNNMSGIFENITLIIVADSNNTIIDGNILYAKGENVFLYSASNSHFDKIINNRMLINGTKSITNQSAIIYRNDSSHNIIYSNMIFSYSINADDYAIVIMDDNDLSNHVFENYLISSNGSKRANEAVFNVYDLVVDNTPYDIYVSVFGSDITGDGSQFNPFRSLNHALNNALNHVIIHMGDGIYFESNLIVDKNITVMGNANVIIDADLNQLFTIKDNGILTIINVTITNGYNIDGGSLFINNGILNIINSTISNSSSYFDNSHPVFDHNVSENYAYTIDCRDTGKGGAILNYGNLFIGNSLFYLNKAHIGGAIADYGRTTIDSSLFYGNSAVHGGVIYTDSDNRLLINNSIFYGNSAITTLNYCMIRKAVSGWSIDYGNSYAYSSLCDVPVGEGGVVYTNNTDIAINNSIFEGNSAWKGGVISTKYVSASANSNLNLDLIVNNCSFVNNNAIDTKLYDDSDLVNNYNYNSDYHGGVIYGAFSMIYLNSSDFINNRAKSNGGVLYVQSEYGVIDLCNFVGNRAGITGGALYISNNFIITRTLITNNSALYGGAVSYDSYYYYGHVQNNLNIYNSTISNNLALNSGGAFRIGQGNITIHYSNIYDNFAPEGSTISSSFITNDPSRVVADMRYNYWGKDSNGRLNVADDSVYNFPNMNVGYRLKDPVNWISVNADDSKNPASPDSGGNSSSHVVVNPVNSHSSSSTQTHIGNNNGWSVSGPSSYPGNSGGVNPSLSNSYGSSTGFSSNGVISNVASLPFGIPTPSNYPNSGMNPQKVPFNVPSSSNVKSNIVNGFNGTTSKDSSSRTDNSEFDDSLNTVGMIANAVSSSDASSSASEGDSSSSSESSYSSSYYEIEEKSVEKNLDDSNIITKFIAVALVTLILLIFGYRRKKNDEY